MIFDRYIQRSFILVIALTLQVAAASDFHFNEQKVPKSQEDLLSIQKALINHLGKSRSATVSIKLKEGFGSGVIVSPDGLVLTAAHVSGDVKKELTVIMNDGKEYKALTMGLLSETDAAMIRITEKLPEGETFPYVEINKANDYQLGHWVYALGHSGGFDQERGPVVRLGRIVQDNPTTLQSDCKVIGGDSGGPLFDMHGRLIAIHSRVGSETVVENRHVPMREYLTHWKELENSQFVGEGPFAKRTIKIADILGIGVKDTEKGVFIVKMRKKGPAAKAGLKLKDIILEINGKKIPNTKALRMLFQDDAEIDELGVKILRGEEKKDIKVKLAKDENHDK